MVTNVGNIYLTLQLAVLIRNSKSTYITYLWENSFNLQPSFILYVCVNVQWRNQDLKSHGAEICNNEIFIDYSRLAEAQSKNCTVF